ncbi:MULTISPECIES: serine hydrolase [Microbacterium]|uniref:serine hydrolase n=1 Tax=Microbacterium TaxID=33882 RepID=UPI0013A54B3D|nr:MULTISPECIES: serine hydrolase [Microbacterium]
MADGMANAQPLPEPSAAANSQTSPGPLSATDETQTGEGDAPQSPTPVPVPTPSSSAPSTEPEDPPEPPEQEIQDPGTDEAPVQRSPQEDAPDTELQDVDPAAAPVVPGVSRLGGGDRFDTSVLASQTAFPSGAATILVASAYAPVDAITAAGLAGALSAPLLYVHPEFVPDTIAAEITRLGATSIVVIGGPAVVPEPIIQRLQTLVAGVRRFGGGDRFETSRMALAGRGGPTDTAYLTGGAGLIDPPVASVAAAATGRAALLVNGLLPSADSETVEALRAAGVSNAVLVGGFGTISSAYEASLRSAGFVVSRKMGSDRYATAVMMAGERLGSPSRAIVANSFATADVGVAAGLAAVTRQPLYYTIKPCMVDAAAAHIAATGVPVTAVGGPVWIGDPVLANRSCASVKADGERRLDSALRSTLANLSGTYAVSVRELGGVDQTVHINGGDRREPASVMKVFAAWAALKRIEQGGATLGTVLPSGVPLGACLQVMIQASDNYCHSDIVHWINIPVINGMIAAAGFASTSYGNVANGTSVLYAGNRTTSGDVNLLLARLRTGEILAPALAEHLFGLMRTQVFRTRIPSGIPPGVPQASKPGALWLAGGLMQADTAIIDGPTSTYVLTVIGDNAASQAAIRAISRTAYQHFHGAFGAAATYPVEQVLTRAATVVRTTPGGLVAAQLPQWYPLQVLDAQRLWYLVQYGSRQVWIYYSDVVTR